MTEQKPRWAVEGVLSDEMLDRHRTRLGRSWEAEGLLDRSAIEIFARAIGDSNPLWQDPAYAASGPYGAPIAPPGRALPHPPRQRDARAARRDGLQHRHRLGPARPRLRGRHDPHLDRLRRDRGAGRVALRRTLDHRALPGRVDESARRGRRAPRTCATCASSAAARAARAATPASRCRTPGRTRSGSPSRRHRRASRSRSAAASRSGGRTSRRGTALEPLVKGPLRMWDMICWFSARGILDGYSRSIRGILDTPALGMLHPASNAREPIEIVHFDNEAARTAGLPGAYDLGAARQSYQLQSLLHALGDEALDQAQLLRVPPLRLPRRRDDVPQHDHAQVRRRGRRALHPGSRDPSSTSARKT